MATTTQSAAFDHHFRMPPFSDQAVACLVKQALTYTNHDMNEEFVNDMVKNCRGDPSCLQALLFPIRKRQKRNASFNIVKDYFDKLDKEF